MTAQMQRLDYGPVAAMPALFLLVVLILTALGVIAHAAFA